MARRWTMGFELNGSDVGLTTSGSPTVQGTTVRSGSFAGQITSLSSGTRKGWVVDIEGVAGFVARFYRVYLRVATLPSAENRIFFVTNSTTISSTQIVYLTLDSGGLLRLYDEDGQIGSASSALSTNTWYRIEVQVDLSAGSGASTHAIAARVDGVDFASASNRAISVGLRGLVWGGNLGAEAQTQGNWYFDDIAYNDTSGSNQTSYPGAGGDWLLTTSGVGDNNAWTRGGADSGANWSQMDEVPPNDITDYVFSNTLNQTDDYALADTPAGIGASDTITVVHVLARQRGEAASDTNAAFVTRIKKVTSGTVSESSATVFNPNSTSWAWRRNSPQAFYDHTLYADPDGSPWTKATLDTAQAGIRLATVDTNPTDVSAVYVLVEAVASGGGGGGSAPLGSTAGLMGVG